MKMSSMLRLKRRAILNASGRLGSYFPTSSALIVWRLTSSFSPRSACDQSRSARKTRRVFFTSWSAVTPLCDFRPDPPADCQHRPHEEHRNVRKVCVRFEEAVRERDDHGDEEREQDALARNLAL